MEDGAIVKWDAVLLGVRDGAGPVFSAVGEADEIRDSDWGYLRKQRAMEVAGRGVDDGGGLGVPRPGLRACGRAALSVRLSRPAPRRAGRWRRSGQSVCSRVLMDAPVSIFGKLRLYDSRSPIAGGATGVLARPQCWTGENVAP